MGVSKVVYGDTTLVDLTSDTVTADTLLYGTTATSASGESITGTYVAPVTSVNGMTGKVTLNANDVGAAAKSTVVEATLAADGWSDGVYGLVADGVTATSNQEVLPGLDITTEQLTALQGANIQDGGQAVNLITIKAFGEVPTIDIPIRVIVRGDM